MKSIKRLRFTLIELLVVIAIISILAGMILGGVAIAAKKAKEATVKANCLEIKSAIQQFYSDTGAFPVISSGGDFDPSQVNTNARGIKYFKGNTVKHPFGTSKTYKVFLDNVLVNDANGDGVSDDGDDLAYDGKVTVTGCGNANGLYTDDVVVVSQGSGTDYK